MLPITRKISVYNHSDGNDIQYIVIHDTGNTTDSDEGNANYFGTGDRQASAHYFVDDNSITQVVEDNKAAWHCGDGHNAYGIGNHNSIGIEMCRINDTVTATTEANTIELVKFLMGKYNVDINHVVRHYDASRKTCPESFSANNWARWNNFKNKLSQPITNNQNQFNEEELFNQMFSEKWYLLTYKDIADNIKNGGFKSGKEHYLTYGQKEGRKPTPPLPLDFNEGIYLESNSDVKKAIERNEFSCGVEHYLMWGFAEGRKYK